MIFSIFAMVSILGASAFDHEMSQQERRETGVYKLSTKEKAALQSWIDVHYQRREQPLILPETKMRSELQENLEGGTYIRLANGSLWNISPEDTSVSQGWITPVDIVVSPSGDNAYPYRLTNTVTGSSIRARSVKDVRSQQKASEEQTPPAEPAANSEKGQ